MSHLQIFKNSLISSKKHAAFRLMPMGKTMQYIFFFILLFTILGFYQFANGIGESAAQLEGVLDYFNEISWLLYPFAFLFLLVVQTLVIFLTLSVIAAAGFFIAPLLKRRADYRFLWRTTLFANTWSFLIQVVSYFLFPSMTYITWLTYMLTFVLVCLALRYYPKLQK
ncbi:DUF1189 family protein [Chryseomicrobium palamuruense]|uniref:DUF1189 family protein n=1 Tax=Chryseomicrobium palamuruense TaxID=682973 RepID=A0ABV8UZS8_9BACL